MRVPKVDPRHAIVTGASTGIGAATALCLRDAGWTVLPTVRNSDDARRLRGEGFTPLILDLADPVSVAAAAAEALGQLGGRPGALVNNAGIGHQGPLEDLSRSAMRHQFEVNVFGMQQFTNALLPAMLANGQGRVVNVSSVLGRIAIPMTGLYSASKFAMEAMSDALRIELAGTGIAVSVVEPGPIRSAFRATSMQLAEKDLDSSRSRFGPLLTYEVARRQAHPEKMRAFTLPPEAVARRILHAVSSSRPRRRYPVTVQAVAGEWARRLLPDAAVDGILRHALRRKMRAAGGKIDD